MQLNILFRNVVLAMHPITEAKKRTVLFDTIIFIMEVDHFLFHKHTTAVVSTD